MEGPSVHRVADRLNIFEQQTIQRVAGNAKQPKEQLQGETITTIRAVKKRLFIETAAATAAIHFLMYGSYRVNEQRERDERLSLHCSHDDLHLYSCSAKILQPGSKTLAEYDDPAGDVLSPRFNHTRALQAMQTDDRIIADVLLDQDIFGGIGNILKNEVLHTTGMHPASRASDIDQATAENLIDTAVRQADAWYRRKQAGERPKWTVYRQQQCPSCGGRLTRHKMGTYDRVTFFCERCQQRYSG